MSEHGTLEHTLASPLTLLIEEEGHGDRQAEEILLLSFTADLGFIESFALGVAHACGARVTVVGDAAVSTYDPRAVRRAGRSYLPGYAACQGAFHPKLMVIAGPARVTVAIGSGNATLAGWQANAELWTVIRASTDEAPGALGDLAGWLRGLADHVRFSWGIQDALGRTAAGLDAILQETARVTDPGLRLISTSTGPIIAGIPQGPVEELAVCAPFHDPGAVALRALCERLAPQRLLISYQPDFTMLDGQALEALIGEYGGELLADPEKRYRHGKLIEWTAAGQRYALTGSPNLSSAALLRGMAQGGNCELGLIAPVGQSLLPEGAPIAPASIRGTRFSVRPREIDGLLLLGAARNDQGLQVLFARPTRIPGHLQLSHAAAPPEVWERVAEVPAGSTELQVTVAADGGSRVRLVTIADDDTPRYSNVVPVVDPQRAVRRPAIAGAQVPTTRPDDLFEDPRLAERFFADLATLRTGLPARPPAAAGSAASRSREAANGSNASQVTWEQYLDECAGRIGHPLLRFALGLPIPDRSEAGYDAVLAAPWDEQFADDAEVGLDDDDPETVADERAGDAVPVAPPALPNLRRGVSETVRRRYRRWADRLTDAADKLGTPERMLVTRLLLWTAAAGAWDEDDNSWIELLAESVCFLRLAEVPGEAEPQVASLVAVALSILRAHAPRLVHTEETMVYEFTVEQIAHLLSAAEPAYVEEYCQLLGDSFGPAADPETVRRHAADVVQADPINDAVRALADLGREVHRHDQALLHVTGRFSNPVLAALEAVAAVETTDAVGAWATGSQGKWALCMWRKPDLIAIDAGGALQLWRHYQLNGLITPSGLAMARSFDNATTVRHGPLIKPFPEALTVLAQLGLSAPEPPADCAADD